MIKATKKIVAPKRKIITGFRPRIRSRHPSHNCLRDSLPRMPFTSVVRFGSTTPNDAKVQINTPQAIMNSASKLRMKTCFMDGNVKTADWMSLNANTTMEQINHFCKDAYPVVLKHIFGSRGNGNTLIRNADQMKSAIQGKTLGNYIIEKFYNYTREYRLHVTNDGCFYTCRKMLKETTPEDKRWFRNDSNSVWILEENENFSKPENWDEIVAECVKAMNACGLDFGACDVRVQSTHDQKGNKRKSQDFIVIEINSAPAFGELTEKKYREMLPILIRKKGEKLNA